MTRAPRGFLYLVQLERRMSHQHNVVALDPRAARDLVVGLLGAIDVADPTDDAEAWWDRA